MRLRRLRADGFLSFDGLDLPFDNRVSMVVGPNGHGKSNLGHVLRCVYSAVASADRDTPELQDTLATYLTARRYGTVPDAWSQQPGRTDHLALGSGDPGRGLRLQVDIELTAARERALVTSFVRAAIVHQLVGNTSGYDIEPINAWVSANVDEAQLAPLHRLSILVTHAGYGDSPWQVSAAFHHPSEDGSAALYEWKLRGSLNNDDITRHTSSVTGGGYNSAPYVTLADRLIGADRDDATGPHTPVDPFRFTHLLPDTQAVAVRCAVDLGTVVTPHTRAFTDAIGIDVRGERDNNRHIGFSRVLHRILDAALVQNDDARLATPSSTRQLGTDPRSAASTERLAEQLIRLKNSRSANRASFDRITRRFAALSNGRQIDVALSPVRHVGRHQEANAPAESMGKPLLLVSIQPAPADHRGEIPQVPIEFAGSGAGESLLLACALEAPEDAVVFLDEPGATLHPTAQRQLAGYLSDSGAQFVVITHSPYLVPYARLAQVDLCRMQLDDTFRSLPWRVDPELLRRLAPKIVAKGNQSLPFASRVVLCEGQSDVTFLTALTARLGLAVEEANVLIVDCGSRENLPDYISFVTALGLAHVVVMDGDAAKAAREPSVRKAAQAVRDAAVASELCVLAEYPEDMESTLGVVKGRALDLASAAASIDLTSDPVLESLQQQLRRIVAG